MLKNLISREFLFRIEEHELSFGSRIDCFSPFGISFALDLQTLPDGRVVLPLRIYEAPDSGKYSSTVYIFLGENGAPESFLEETEGVNPNLFYDCDGEIWVRLTPLDVDGDKAILVPLFNRENLERSKPKRELGWSFVGASATGALFHFHDSWKAKDPDKIHWVTWKKGAPQMGKVLKLSSAGEMELQLDHSGNLHGLQYQYEARLIRHFIFDENGQELRSQEFAYDPVWVRPVNMSADGQSLLLLAGDRNFSLASISPSGEMEVTELVELSGVDEFFNVFEVKSLGEGRWGIRFNHEKGNGWMIFDQEKCLECYYANSGSAQSGYQNEVTGNQLDFPSLANPGLTGDGKGGYFLNFMGPNETYQKGDQDDPLIADMHILRRPAERVGT